MNNILDTKLLLILCLFCIISIGIVKSYPDYALITGDSAYYTQIARNLVSGKGLTEDFIWIWARKDIKVEHPMLDFRKPSMIFLIAGSLMLFGFSNISYILPSLLNSIIALVILYKISCKLSNNKNIAYLTLLIFTFNDTFITNSLRTAIPNYIMTFNLAAFYFITKYIDTKKIKHFMLVILFAALAAQFRSYGIFVFGTALFFLIVFDIYNKIFSIKKVLIGIFIFLALNLPWSIRNKIVWSEKAGGANIMFKAGSTEELYRYHNEDLKPIYKRPKIYFSRMALSIYRKIKIVGMYIPYPLFALAVLGFYLFKRKVYFYYLMLYALFSFLAMIILIPGPASGTWGEAFIISPVIYFLAVFALFNISEDINNNILKKSFFIIITLGFILYQSALNFDALYHSKGYLMNNYNFIQKLKKKFNNERLTFLASDLTITLNFTTNYRTVLLPSLATVETVLELFEKYDIDYVIGNPNNGFVKDDNLDKYLKLVYESNNFKVYTPL